MICDDRVVTTQILVILALVQPFRIVVMSSLREVSSKDSESSGKHSTGGGIPRAPSQHNGDGQHKKRSSATTKGHKKHYNVDFALQQHFKVNDPAESNLLHVLEDQEEASYNDVASASPSAGISQRKTSSSSRGHRRRASKLQQMVKQISSRRLLGGAGGGGGRRGRYYGSYDDDDDEDNMNNSQTYQSRSSLDSSQQGSESRLYNTLSTMDNVSRRRLSSHSIPQSPGNRRRTSSINKSYNNSNQTNAMDLSRQSSAGRRASVQSHDLQQGPTSEYLTDLAENLNEIEDSDYEQSKVEAAAMPEEMIHSARKGRRHRRQRTTTDALYDHAQQLESLVNGTHNTYGDLPTEFFSANHDKNTGDNPQLDGPDDNYSDISDDDEGNRDRDLEGGNDVRRPLLGRRQTQQRQLSARKRAYAFLLAFFTLLGPQDIWNGIKQFILRTILLIMIPLLGISAALFYGFHNPNFHFLPANATMSWWLIFVVRLLVTFNLARATQYMLEIFTTRTTLIVRIAGPFVALIGMQSVGWPFLMASWGTWCLILMRGYHPFVKNWVWFLHIDMFSKEHNPDGGVLESDLYGRILTSLLFVGVATAAKRTVVALYLSRRMLQYYRRQLRELLADMKLVMEVAELAAETESEEFSKLMANELITQDSIRSTDMALTALKASQSMAEALPSFSSPATKVNDILRQPSIDEDDEEDDDVDDDLIPSDDEDVSPLPGFAATPLSARSGKSGRSALSSIQRGLASVQGPEPTNKGSVNWSELKNQAKLKRMQDRSSSPVEVLSSVGDVRRERSSSRRGIEKLAQRLENWDEPETKATKVMMTNIVYI